MFRSSSRGHALLSSESLRRIQEVLDRISAGEAPNAGMLAGAPLAESWATIAGDDIHRMGAVVAAAPKPGAQVRIVPLLALDPAQDWALVFVDNDAIWWSLGDPLPGGAAPEDSAEILRLSRSWARRWLGNA
jgi:hypothetical protein